ncbi:hypothetical protein Bca101_043774 [Brassica carinata]
MIMDQSTKEDNEIMDEPADEDALAIPEGPMTRARSRQLKEVIGGLLKTSLKQEESLGRSLIITRHAYHNSSHLSSKIDIK